MKKMTNRKTNSVSTNRELTQNVQGRIVTLLDRKNGSWTGTMSELGVAITSGIRRSATTDWPKSPSVLRRVVNAVIPALRRSGVSVRFSRSSDHMRTRFVSFESR